MKTKDRFWSLNYSINWSRSRAFLPPFGLKWQEPKVLIYISRKKGRTKPHLPRVAGPEEYCGYFTMQLSLWSSVCSGLTYATSAVANLPPSFVVFCSVPALHMSRVYPDATGRSHSWFSLASFEVHGLASMGSAMGGLEVHTYAVQRKDDLIFAFRVNF